MRVNWVDALNNLPPGMIDQRSPDYIAVLLEVQEAKGSFYDHGSIHWLLGDFFEKGSRVGVWVEFHERGLCFVGLEALRVDGILLEKLLGNRLKEPAAGFDVVFILGVELCDCKPGWEVFSVDEGAFEGRKGVKKLICR